jgi:hypothetical protein
MGEWAPGGTGSTLAGKCALLRRAVVGVCLWEMASVPSGTSSFQNPKARGARAVAGGRGAGGGEECVTAVALC